ncbi:uncharacterized protein LOC111947739 isoform X2 [Oryzias latipes]|uniref:uncharacterized protein LOC111947739 isoform X2 n=1 Tax=Oryzias latipes TaxID=8090 RepID=UPI000CE21022|nr:uncharacterized protein LOC111947739 isoform X2 [Oryzias latipes]
MTERTGHSPDPADPEGLRFAVTQQGIALGRQAESLNQMATVQQDLFRRLDGISHALMDLTGQQSSIAAASTSFSATGSPGPAIANAANENIRLQPEVFHGDVKACGGFLLQCRLIFQQAPRHYHADQSKITLIVNSLRAPQGGRSYSPITSSQATQQISQRTPGGTYANRTLQTYT